jgi:hypothetical protein
MRTGAVIIAWRLEDWQLSIETVNRLVRAATTSLPERALAALLSHEEEQRVRKEIAERDDLAYRRGELKREVEAMLREELPHLEPCGEWQDESRQTFGFLELDGIQFGLITHHGRRDLAVFRRCPSCGETPVATALGGHSLVALGEALRAEAPLCWACFRAANPLEAVEWNDEWEASQHAHDEARRAQVRDQVLAILQELGLMRYTLEGLEAVAP